MAFTNFINGLFYLINGFIVLCGLAALGLGVWIFVDAENFTHIAGIRALNVENAETCGQIMMACGAGVIVFATVGVAGAKFNIVCLMVLYLLLVVALLGIQLASLILGVFLRQEAENILESSFRKNLQAIYSGPRGEDLFTDAFNAFMSDRKCCGLTNGSTDFVYETQAWNRTIPNGDVRLVPSQCCKPSYRCETRPDHANSYTKGCLEVVRELVYKYHTVIIAVSTAVVCLQFLLVILDVCLIGNRRKN